MLTAAKSNEKYKTKGEVCRKQEMLQLRRVQRTQNVESKRQKTEAKNGN